MVDEYLRVFRAFTDKNRIQILELLCKGEQCACILLEDLQISQPTLSHHMKILCKSGIVKSRRVGPWNYYSINTDGCSYASQLLTIIAQQKLDKTLKIVKVWYSIVPFSKKQVVEKRQKSTSCCCRTSEIKSRGNIL